MPSLTPAQAAVLSRPQLLRGLIENEPTIDQLLPRLPWMALDGYEAQVPAVNAASLGAAGWPGAGGAAPAAAAVPVVPAAAYGFARIVRDVILDSYVVDTRSSDMDLPQVEVDAAIRSVLYTLGDGLINGSAAANPAQVQGFKSAVTAGQTIGANNNAVNGGPLLLSDFDRLRNKITARNGRPDFIVVNLATYRAWIALHHAAGIPLSVGLLCADHHHASLDGEDPDAACPERMAVLLHRDVPVLVSEYILSNEAKGAGVNLTSAYAVALGEAEGAVLTYPARFDAAPLVVTRIFNGEADQERYRVALSVALVVATPAGLARLDGILN